MVSWLIRWLRSQLNIRFLLKRAVILTFEPGKVADWSGLISCISGSFFIGITLNKNKFPCLQTSHAAMRNMMACTVTGQAAGVAAAVSFKTGSLTGEVKIAAVQEELRRQGVRIHWDRAITDLILPGLSWDTYRVTIQVVTNQNKSSGLGHGPHTKTELLFWCQWEVCHNLNDHPVYAFVTSLTTLTFNVSCFVVKILLIVGEIKPSWYRYRPCTPINLSFHQSIDNRVYCPQLWYTSSYRVLFSPAFHNFDELVHKVQVFKSSPVAHFIFHVVIPA